MPRFIPANPTGPERKRCPVSGKLPFESEREAREEADRLREKRGVELDVYLCLSCDRWHFTSS